MRARRITYCGAAALTSLALIATPGCDDDSSDGDDSGDDAALGSPEVVNKKNGVTVVHEVDRPDANRRGFRLEVEVEPRDLPNSDALLTALDESLSARSGFSTQAEADIAAAYQFSIEYGEALLRSPGSGTSWVYKYAVPPAECVSLNAQNARCTIYVYTEELGNGHGGVDRWVRREHLLAFRVGDGVYNTSFNFVDFTGGQPICSDGNIAGIPLCSPNGPS